MEDWGVLMWEEKGSPPSMVLIAPPLFFIYRGHLAPYNSLLLPLNIPPYPGILAKPTPEQKEKNSDIPTLYFLGVTATCCTGLYMGRASCAKNS